jgi:hypothetical protein
VSGHEPRSRRGALRSFVFGSAVGGAIAIVAPRVRRLRAPVPPRPPGGDPDPQRTAGLVAFEGAPCWDYDREQEAKAALAAGRRPAGAGRRAVH